MPDDKSVHKEMTDNILQAISNIDNALQEGWEIRITKLFSPNTEVKNEEGWDKTALKKMKQNVTFSVNVLDGDEDYIVEELDGKGALVDVIMSLANKTEPNPNSRRFKT